MPSPFPGMDPYLENRALWPGFHHRFMTYASDAIQELLPPQYVALLELRIYLEYPHDHSDEYDEQEEDERVPDLEIVRVSGVHALETANGEANGSKPFRGQWIAVPPVEHREAYIHIRIPETGRLVTSIELLSPSNKRAGAGSRDYRRKQDEMVDSGTNLVEIDLLRGGRHTVLVPLEALAKVPKYDYLVSVWRDWRDDGYEVFSWNLREPLPTISVPLLKPDGEIALNLQKVLDQTYDKGRFRRVLRYDRAPSPRLGAADRTWAADLLRKAHVGKPA